MKTTKTILTKIVHILIVIFTGNTQASFTETVAEGTTVSGEIVAPQEWDGLNRNHQRVFGTVTDTILRGDSQNYSPPNWAQQDVFSGGYTNNITVENTGNQSIFGGTAENTVIKDEGRATLKNQGIFKEGKVYKGGFFSAQSGTVDNINVYENGQFDISGNDDGVIVEGGEITYLAKGSIFQGRAKINNLKISGNVVVSDNGSKYSPDFSRANIKPGGLLRLSTGRMINSSVK
ncbi:hypothetical protein [Candidatus Williamhamiltonella defendens]|uniref:hypothetical protein n=1 Tax=Candidatus Williamhamiltonella defendens TaxID=138072 RepID=UPI00158148F1|nr:hypothetical protein [Candidatus Hamiltonella defensa]